MALNKPISLLVRLYWSIYKRPTKKLVFSDSWGLARMGSISASEGHMVSRVHLQGGRKVWTPPPPSTAKTIIDRAISFGTQVVGWIVIGNESQKKKFALQLFL